MNIQPINKNNIKLAESNEFSPDVLALYIQSLKLSNKERKIKNPSEEESEISKLINTLPSPAKIKKDFSNAECAVIFETIAYLWREITGKNIREDAKLKKAEERLMGNFWLINKGVIIGGVNHFSIIKQNSNLIGSLLDINQMVLQQYLSLQPNKLILLVIKSGGIRLFCNKNKKLFAQMSEDTYAQWGRNKIQKYDFKDKLVKIIDLNSPYKGWSSGISIVL